MMWQFLLCSLWSSLIDIKVLQVILAEITFEAAVMSANATG